MIYGEKQWQNPWKLIFVSLLDNPNSMEEMDTAHRSKRQPKCLDFRFFISRTDTFLRSGCIVSATSDHYFLFQPKHTAYFHYVSYQGKAPYEEYIEETDGGTCKFCSYLKRELISNNRAAAQRYRQTQAPGTELLCATRSPLPGTFSSAYFI